MAWNQRIDPITGQPGRHDGIDLPFGLNAPMAALQGGVVSNIGNDPNGYGNYVDVLHDDGTTGRYAHAGVINRGVGHRVEKGDELGLVGSTGRSTGPHVHFEHRDQAGSAMDPRTMLAGAPQSNLGGPVATATSASAPQSNPGVRPMATAFPAFNELLARARSQMPESTIDPALTESITRGAQARSANLPLAMGAMLSGDKSMNQTGNAMYRDAQAANGLVPVGDEGFVDPTTGKFIASPVASNKRNQSILQLAMAEDAKYRVAESASADREAARAIAQQGVNDRNNFNDQLLGIRQQMADQAGVNATAKAEAAAAGKVLPSSEYEKLNGARANIVQFDVLNNTFKDSYAAATDMGGELSNLIGRNGFLATPNMKAGANWWQNYQSLFNAQLKELSGAAVTVGEAARFQAAAITPGMDPNGIRTRLAQQAEIMARSHNMLVGSLGKGGYNMKGFEPITPSMQAPAPGSLDQPMPTVPGSAAPGMAQPGAAPIVSPSAVSTPQINAVDLIKMYGGK